MSNAGGQIDTMLRHLGSGHDLPNFPGTTAEKLGLMRTTSARELISCSKAPGPYELTSVGFRQRRGLAFLVVCTSFGAVIGAGALADLLLPDASHRPAGRQAPASVSRPVDPGGGLRTPMEPAQVAPKVRSDRVPTAPPDTSMQPAQAAPKVRPDPVPTAPPDTPAEPARVAEQPILEQPIATATPTIAKQAAVKKSRHKTGRAQTYRTWASANSYRDERYAGFGRTFR